MAYAIFQTGSKQYRVNSSDVIDVDKIDAEPGSELTFNSVLLVGEGADVKVGTAAQGASVIAEVVEQYRGPKLVAYKYRRRKGYQRKVGFRRELTKLRIKAINA